MRGVVDDDHLVLVAQRLKAAPQVVAGVVADDDDAEAQGGPVNPIACVKIRDSMLVSQDGYEKLKSELEHLKAVERQKVADNIREAKSHGDLKENAMYHEAKLNQKRLETRIADLEHALQVAQVVDHRDQPEDVAHIGSVVQVKDLEWGDELVLTLVGGFEADPANDLISVTSPLGEALLGKTVGDEVSVVAPAGTQRYEILSVKAGS